MNSALPAEALFEEARDLELTDVGKALDVYDHIYKAFIDVDINTAARACYKAGIVCQSAGNFKSAVQYFNKAIHNQFPEAADCFLRLGDIYAFLNDNAAAIDNYFHAAAIHRDNNNLTQYAELLNKIGDCYKLLGEYQNAIDQHKKALSIFESQNDLYNQCISNFYIGNCYNWADELDVAYNYLQKCLNIADKLRNPEVKIKPQGSMAILFTKNKKYDLSQDYFFQAIDNANLSGNITIKADLLKSLGNLYIETGEYEKAIKTLEEALAITEKIQVKFPANLIHQFLARVYEIKGDYEKALYHFKIYYNLSKELNTDQANVKSIGLQLKFDTEELKKEKTQAEQNLLLKDKFLASISHELRTPLNGILGMTDVLSDSNLAEEQAKHLDVIKTSALNLMAVINDLFNYALLNSGQVKKEEVKFSIDDLIKSVTQLVSYENKNSDVKDFKIDSSVDNLIFVTDKYILEKILKPILQFVRKYSKEGYISMKIKAGNITTGKDVVLKFSIPFVAEKEMDAVNYFDQEGNVLKSYAEHGYESLSIGNALKFAETLDGRVTLGGKFPNYEIQLSVLVKTIVAADSTTPKAEARPVAVANDFKILLVDDNKVNQFLAKTLLNKNGYFVDLASSGEEALKKVGTNSYGVIITDIHMPGKSGYELSAGVRALTDKKKSTVPIFALTAYESATEKHKAREAGISEFLSKPFNPHELVNLLQKYISKGKAAKTEPDAEDNSTPDVKGNLSKIMGGNAKETKKLADMLCEQVPSLLAEIEAAIQKKDYQSSFKGLHKLKSSVGLFGLKKVNDLSEVLEKNYRSEKNINDSLKKFDEFKKLCLQVVDTLKT